MFRHPYRNEVVDRFAIFFRLGVGHIANLQAYDHLLFILALTIGYRPREWRRLLVLITAFTIGHSLTLALATLEVVRVRTAVVEVLIPVTILAMAALDLSPGLAGGTSSVGPRGMALRYALAAGFGLIHGLGFSAFLRSLLGEQRSIVTPLLAFNLGLELGQLLIVSAVLLLSLLVVGTLGFPRRRWVLGLSGLTGILATLMIVRRL